MKTIAYLRKKYGNARVLHYLDGSIGILINNVTYATENDNVAYYANSRDYTRRHILSPRVWMAIRSEENEMVRIKEAG
jgi:hypothetical protein